MNKLLICQYYTPNIEYGVYVEKINQLYCQKFNIDYFCEKDEKIINKSIGDRTYHWYKIKLLIEQLEKNQYEYVMFIDIDAFFTKNDYDIIDILKKYSKYDLIGTEDFDTKMILNTGVLIFKNTEWSLNFLKKIWNNGDSLFNGKYKKIRWHEQYIIDITLTNSLLDKEKTIILKREGNNILNNNFLQCGKTLIYHACSNEFCKKNIKNINIEEVYHLNKTPNDLQKELSLLAETDRNFIFKYSYIYIYLINSFLKKKSFVNVLDISCHDSGGLFNVICKYYPNLNYYSLTTWPYYKRNNNMHSYQISEYIDDNIIKNLKEKLNNVNYDIIISDFDHKTKHTQLIFKEFFPLLNSKGVFIVEDLQVDLQIKIPEFNNQHNWGDPNKKCFTDLINQFNVDKTFKSDYYNFDNLESHIESAKIINISEIYKKLNADILLGLIYKK
jgi:hypothetical protein